MRVTGHTVNPVVVSNVVAAVVKVARRRSVIAVMKGPGMTYLADILIKGFPVGKGTRPGGTGQFDTPLQGLSDCRIVKRNIASHQFPIGGSEDPVLFLGMGIVAGNTRDVPVTVTVSHDPGGMGLHLRRRAEPVGRRIGIGRLESSPLRIGRITGRVVTPFALVTLIVKEIIAVMTLPAEEFCIIGMYGTIGGLQGCNMGRIKGMTGDPVPVGSITSHLCHPAEEIRPVTFGTDLRVDKIVWTVARDPPFRVSRRRLRLKSPPMAVAVGTRSLLTVADILTVDIEISRGIPFLPVMAGPGVADLADRFPRRNGFTLQGIPGQIVDLHDPAHRLTGHIVLIGDLFPEEFPEIGAVGPVLFLGVRVVAGDTVDVPAAVFRSDVLRGVALHVRRRSEPIGKRGRIGFFQDSVEGIGVIRRICMASLALETKGIVEII